MINDFKIEVQPIIRLGTGNDYKVYLIYADGKYMGTSEEKHLSEYDLRFIENVKVCKEIKEE